MLAYPPAQEVRAPNVRLLDFLRRTECMEALLRYAVLPPPPATPDAAAAALRRSKYPQAACEVGYLNMGLRKVMGLLPIISYWPAPRSRLQRRL